MSIVVRAPSRPLAPFVAVLGYYESGLEDARDLLLPAGFMHLAVNLTEDEACWYDGDGFATVQVRRGAVLGSASAGPIGIDLATQRAVSAAVGHGRS